MKKITLTMDIALKELIQVTKKIIYQIYKIVSGSNFKNLKKISKIYSNVAPKFMKQNQLKIAESSKNY